MPTGVYARKRTPAADRALARVTVHPLGCWEFTGRLDRKGYGRVNEDGRCSLAHRVVYEAEVGPIPDGLTIDHLCFNSRCLNPAHMEVVTASENSLRKWRAGRVDDSPGSVNSRKTHCPRGHAYDEANTHFRPDGRRRCRACSRAEDRTRRTKARSQR